MSKEIKFGSCLTPFNSCADRFVRSGYSRTERDVSGIIQRASRIHELSGIELVGTLQITDENIFALKKRD